MPPSAPHEQLAREWLTQAGRDLRLAGLAALDPTLAGLAAFHCQQAAEKALKCYLVWRNQPLSKTHDLPMLLVQCQAFDAAFSVLQTAAQTLDDYLTAGRYPDTGPDPSEAEAEQARVLAAQVIEFVLA